MNLCFSSHASFVALLHEYDIDRSAINWHKRFMEIMIACIPRKSLRRRRNLPWLTKNIIQHIRKRNAAFQAAKNSAKTEKYSKFRKLRNEVVSMLRNAKSSYFKKLILIIKSNFGSL